MVHCLKGDAIQENVSGGYEMKHQTLIAQMTLEEKAGLCSGADYWRTKPVERLGIPSIRMSDGPHGLRKQVEGGDFVGIGNSRPATCFPSAAAIANSWDVGLLEEMGAALGEEAVSEQIALVLGPGVNIKRSPLCGRNFEYYSEDPFLSGRLGVAYIKGMQSRNVGACVKHFAANNQETRRMTINTVVDERTLREIYLTAFEMCVREAAPHAVMSAYNRLNGNYCTENSWLLDVLKKEWRYDGIVVSDWGAVNDRVEGIRAGNELEMPSRQGESDAEIVAAVRNGILQESILNERVDRLLACILRAKANGYPEEHGERSDEGRNSTGCLLEAHHRLATRLAEASVVLMKNEGEFLPMKAGAKFAVIGDMARAPRYQGAGSSTICPTRLDNACACFAELFGTVDYAPGYLRHSPKSSARLVREACSVAEGKDMVILFAGLPENYETEGLDREHLDLPANQNGLIDEICRVNPNVVVVLSGGAPFLMPWLGKVKAVVNGYLGGQAGARAMVNILTGKVNPEGKLAETWPMKLSDTPAYGFFPGTMERVEYRESLFVGYRHFESAKKDVLFPFGFGLSYTAYRYSNLVVTAVGNKRTALQPPEAGTHGAGNTTDASAVRFQVSLMVANTGRTAGVETIQLYVAPINPFVSKASIELKGFTRVRLDPGEGAEVTIPLTERSFAHYDVQCGCWKVESGSYRILVGASVQDIRLEETLLMDFGRSETDLQNETESPTSNQGICGQLKTYEDATGNQGVRDQQKPYRQVGVAGVADAYNETISREKQSDDVATSRLLTGISTLEQGKNCFLAGFLYHVIRLFILRPALRRGNTNKAMMAQTLLQMPFHGFARMSAGLIDSAMLAGLLAMLNGHFLRGLAELLSAAASKNRKRKTSRQ